MARELTPILLLLGPMGSGKSFFIRYKLGRWLSARTGLPVAEEVEGYRQTARVEVYVESLMAKGNTLYVVLPDLPGEKLESQLRPDNIYGFDVKSIKGRAKKVKKPDELNKLCERETEKDTESTRDILECIAGIICNMVNQYDRITLLFLYTPEGRSDRMLDMLQALTILSRNVASECASGDTVYFDIVLVFNKLDMAVKSASKLGEFEYSVMLAPFVSPGVIQKRVVDMIEVGKLCTFASLLEAGVTVLSAERVMLAEKLQGLTYYQRSINNVVFRLTTGYSYLYRGRDGKYYADRLFTPYLVESIARPEGHLLPPAPLVTLPFTHLVTSIRRNYCLTQI